MMGLLRASYLHPLLSTLGVALTHQLHAVKM